MFARHAVADDAVFRRHGGDVSPDRGGAPCAKIEGKEQSVRICRFGDVLQMQPASTVIVPPADRLIRFCHALEGEGQCAVGICALDKTVLPPHGTTGCPAA